MKENRKNTLGIRKGDRSQLADKARQQQTMPRRESIPEVNLHDSCCDDAWKKETVKFKGEEDCSSQVVAFRDPTDRTLSDTKQSSAGARTRDTEDLPQGLTTGVSRGRCPRGGTSVPSATQEQA